MVLCGCVSTVAGVAIRATGAAPEGVPPLRETQLDDVLLSIGELNGIVGSTQMAVTSELQEMTDHSGDVADPACLGAIYGAEAPVYADFGWTAMRDQVAREPVEDNPHWVEQTAVLYPSEAHAQRFFEASAANWRKCAGAPVGVDDGIATYAWDLDEVFTSGDMITQVSVQQNAGGWGCQHALSVVSNVTVEAWACSYSLGDEAATIATEMIDNAVKAAR